MVVLAGCAPQAGAASLERLHGDEIAGSQIVDAGAAGDHFAAQLVAENHRVLDARQRMRRRAGRDGTVVTFMQVAAADAVEENAQFDVVRAGRRFRD